MNTTEINFFARKSKALAGHYLGCYPADQLPDHKFPTSRLPFGLVINLCTSSVTDDEFCHWVGIWCQQKDKEKSARAKLYYFDSSGEPTHLSNSFIRDFIRRQQKTTITEHHQIQSLTSDRCGKFVLCYLHLRASAFPLSKWRKMFHKRDLEKNDVVVDKLFKKIFLNNQ